MGAKKPPKIDFSPQNQTFATGQSITGKGKNTQFGVEPGSLAAGQMDFGKQANEVGQNALGYLKDFDFNPLGEGGPTKSPYYKTALDAYMQPVNVAQQYANNQLQNQLNAGGQIGSSYGALANAQQQNNYATQLAGAQQGALDFGNTLWNEAYQAPLAAASNAGQVSSGLSQAVGLPYEVGINYQNSLNSLQNTQANYEAQRAQQSQGLLGGIANVAGSLAGFPGLFGGSRSNNSAGGFGQAAASPSYSSAFNWNPQQAGYSGQGALYNPIPSYTPSLGLGNNPLYQQQAMMYGMGSAY